MFLQASVILSTRGVSGRENPPWQGDRAHPPPAERTLRQGDHPGRENPPAGRPPPPPRQGEPRSRETPPGKENPPRAIQSMSGRYASYWNALLFEMASYPSNQPG